MNSSIAVYFVQLISLLSTRHITHVSYTAETFLIFLNSAYYLLDSLYYFLLFHQGRVFKCLQFSTCIAFVCATEAETALPCRSWVSISQISCLAILFLDSKQLETRLSIVLVMSRF
jgi:hypothetical protein